jgi:hypothetical protein
VHDVWILNAEEAKEKRPGSTGTMFNFTTDSATNSARGQRQDAVPPAARLPALIRAGPGMPTGRSCIRISPLTAELTGKHPEFIAANPAGPISSPDSTP